MLQPNTIENFIENKNHVFLNKAKNLEPVLIRETVTPKALIEVIKKNDEYSGRKIGNIQANGQKANKGMKICMDFGRHCVGYVKFSVLLNHTIPDAPAFIRLKFGEQLCEIAEDHADYKGELSSSWIQEEYIHVDVLPAEIQLPRRYAFRYMEIYIIDTSPQYDIVIDNISCETVTSADMSVPVLPDNLDEEMTEIYMASLNTMRSCMQLVFEDGPKRDRRLWIGDLRLQALTNYETFKNYDLAKRCLYLFAGLTINEGKVTSCLYVEPAPRASMTYLFDYSLFFISCLYDYYKATGDKKILKELWDVAYRQIEIAWERVDDNGVVRDSDDWWCFIDWDDDLNKQAGAQAIFIYTLKQAREIAKVLTCKEKVFKIDFMIERLTNAALVHLWDETTGFFVSGQKRQISWASQVWFVLAEVFDCKSNAELMKRTIYKNPKIRMRTPYMHHHFVEALYMSEMSSEAQQHMRDYWGSMINDGADCFFEIYDPENRNISPYGDRVIHSYCHAWSGTPAYFIHRYAESFVQFPCLLFQK